LEAVLRFLRGELRDGWLRAEQELELGDEVGDQPAV
jgi:hypothetical protein